MRVLVSILLFATSATASSAPDLVSLFAAERSRQCAGC